MLFPESQRVVYKNNPLAEVICQFRFPTILRIGEGHLADFQDSIRNEYPIYTPQEPSIEVPQLPKELSALKEHINIGISGGPLVHRFATTDAKRFVSLAQDFLALAESKYERWELFRTEIQKGERALREVYNPVFYSRIGLRYRDIISRRRLGLDGVEWKELLKPHVTGELGDEVVSRSVNRIQTRAVIVIPDIPDGRITLTHGLGKPRESDEECYIIDADFSVERKEGINEPFKTLDKFNRLAGRLFRWAITEKLHSAMEPQAV